MFLITQVAKMPSPRLITPNLAVNLSFAMTLTLALTPAAAPATAGGLLDLLDRPADCGCDGMVETMDAADCGCEVCQDLSAGGCDAAGAQPSWSERLRSGTDRLRSKMVGLISRKESSCDDGCDAMMIQELSSAMPFESIHLQPIPHGGVHSGGSLHHHQHHAGGNSVGIIHAPAPPRQNVRRRVDTGVVIPSPPSDIGYPSTGGSPTLPPASSPQSLPQSRPAEDSMDLYDRNNDPFLDDDRISAAQPIRRTSHRRNRP